MPSAGHAAVPRPSCGSPPRSRSSGRTAGWPGPADLGHLEAVSVAVSRLPHAGGPLGPREVRSRLTTGELTAEQVAEIVVTATVLGLERASRYVPTQLARPLNLLTQVGIDDLILTDEVLRRLTDACAATGAVVEISEAWRSPSAQMVARLREAGVPMVAGERRPVRRRGRPLAVPAARLTETEHHQYARPYALSCRKLDEHGRVAMSMVQQAVDDRPSGPSGDLGSSR